jgi:hypothetical protein
MTLIYEEILNSVLSLSFDDIYEYSVYETADDAEPQSPVINELINLYAYFWITR